jgi:hypothetical protein
MRRSSTNIESLKIRSFKKKTLTENLAKDELNANKIFTKSISNNRINHCAANSSDNFGVKKIVIFLVFVFCFIGILFYYKYIYDG